MIICLAVCEDDCFAFLRFCYNLLIYNNFFHVLLLRNGLNRAYTCFGTFKMPILMFNSILVFRPEGQI